MTRPFRLEFELPGLPTIEPNARRHWSKRSKEARRWKREVWLATREAMRGRQPLVLSHITMTRLSATEPDVDNRAASFKPVLDGLTEAGVIVDDGPLYVDVIYRWEHAKKLGGRIRVVVEEVLPPHSKNCTR